MRRSGKDVMSFGDSSISRSIGSGIGRKVFIGIASRDGEGLASFTSDAATVIVLGERGLSGANATAQNYRSKDKIRVKNEMCCNPPAMGLVAQPTSVALIIEHVGPGSVFGEGSTLGCSRRIDEAISRGQTELLTIPGDDFRQTLNLVPKLRWRVLKRYVEYLIKSVSQDKVKLCHALLEMQLPELVEEPLVRRRPPRNPPPRRNPF